MQNNAIDLKLDTKKIYRYIPFERLKEIINSKKLTLVNPLMWDDPHENFFLRGNAITTNNEHVSLAELTKDWYGQCWTSHRESDAMWRIYCPNKDGIRVSTTTEKLFDSLWDAKDKSSTLKYFIGQVIYKPKSYLEDFVAKTSFLTIAKGGQNNNFAKLLCIKTRPFEYESEIRILVNDINSNVGHNGLYIVDFDYQNILDDICFDPRMSLLDYQKLKGELESMGCKLPIDRSEMYRFNLPPIELG